MAQTISWIATFVTVIAAFMTASNLGSRITGFGFLGFTIGALCWIVDASVTHQPALLWTNCVLLLVDLFGMWRWLGRQARVDEGARSASDASALTPGEALFPVSLLHRGHVECDHENVAVCIEAMAGADSGRLDYLVVSQGGLAGMGEVLRKLPWRHARVDDEKIVANLETNEFENLPILQKDEWPAH